jgi:glycerol-3-phosphate dehydrogenase
LRGTSLPPGPVEERTIHAVREEMALHLDDVVLRRLDLGTAARPEPADLEAVCRVLRTELAWSEERERGERDVLEARYPPARVPIGA